VGSSKAWSPTLLGLTIVLDCHQKGAWFGGEANPNPVCFPVSDRVVHRVHHDRMDNGEIFFWHSRQGLVECNIDKRTPVRDEFLEVTS
jgi:hypothetical protein